LSFANLTLNQYFPPGRTLFWLILTQIGVAAALSFAVVEYPVWVMLALCAIPTVIAVLLWPELLTLLVFFVMSSNAAAIAVQFHGIPFIIGASAPLLLLVPLANYVSLRRQKLIFHELMIWVLLFHLVQLFGTIFARNVDAAMGSLLEHLVEGIVFYFLIINAVRTPTVLRLVLWVLLLSGAFLGALGFAQVMTGNYTNDYWGFAQISNAAFKTGEETLQGQVEQPRLAGSIGEQNRHAQVMLMLVPLGIFLFMSERSYLLRILLAGMTGLTAIGVATTFSRGAALGFALVLLVMVFLRYITIFQLLAVAVGLVLLISLALPQYVTRLGSLQGLVGLVAEDSSSTESGPDGSLKNRSVEMLAAALVFVDHPVVGVGPNMFRYYFKEYTLAAGETTRGAEARMAHNLYLSIAADHGVLGLLTYLGGIGFTLRGLAQARRRLQEQNPALAAMATGFILAIVTCLATGIGLHFGYARFYWLIMALACATIQIARAQSENNVAVQTAYVRSYSTTVQ
jgi:hypothetical protein